MKRFLTIAFVTCLFATSAMAQVRYGWTVSSSNSDPNVNSGPVGSGVISMYLWYACNDGYPGMAAAEMTIETSPGNVILAFVTANGYLNAGSATSLLLAVGGCPPAPINAGSFLVSKNTPLDMCFINPAAERTVDCEPNPNPWFHDFVGFSETGTPCSFFAAGDGLCVPTVSVEDASWGSIKGLYR